MVDYSIFRPLIHLDCLYMKDFADLFARIFIAFIFLFEAVDSILYFSETKETLTAYGLTWRQDLLLGTVIFVLVLGAISVAIGYYSKFGAFLLLLYWIPFTFIVYSFWNDSESIKRLHGLYFMRNMGVASALLLLLANGAGKYSIKRLIHVMRLPK